MLLTLYNGFNSIWLSTKTATYWLTFCISIWGWKGKWPSWERNTLSICMRLASSKTATTTSWEASSKSMASVSKTSSVSVPKLRSCKRRNIGLSTPLNLETYFCMTNKYFCLYKWLDKSSGTKRRYLPQWVKVRKVVKTMNTSTNNFILEEIIIRFCFL